MKSEMKFFAVGMVSMLSVAMVLAGCKKDEGDDSPVVEFTLNRHEAPIETGDTVMLSYKISSGSIIKSEVWSTSNSSVAKIDEKSGIVTALSEGEAYISVRVNGQYSDSCLVTVDPYVPTANCYLVSAAGTYSFKAKKGNSREYVDDIKKVAVLWESYGTSVAPDEKDIISDVKCEKRKITYTVTNKKGNALIAAMDGNDNVLWSWHIWCTDRPEEQTYDNGAGTVMDRNLGATDTVKGSPAALGLLYQWGRKDPFLGSSHIASDIMAASTLASWPTKMVQDNSDDRDLNLRISIQHPTAFIKDNRASYDWYTPDTRTRNDSLWRTTSGKTIYDPCPVGWRVPEGGSNGLWAKAFNYRQPWTTEGNWDFQNLGMDFGMTDRKLGSGTIWYPGAGCLDYSNPLHSTGLTDTGYNGYYWSCSTPSKDSYMLLIKDDKTVDPVKCDFRSVARSVRCVKE